MGFLWLQAYGEKDTMIIEEIAKEHKADLKVVAKYYKEMLEKIEKENETE